MSKPPRLLALIEDIKADLESLDEIVASLSSLRTREAELKPIIADHFLTLMSTLLHHYYTGFESICERIAEQSV